MFPCLPHYLVLFFILTVSHSLCVCPSILLLSLSLFLSLFVSVILLMFLFSCLCLSICLFLSVCVSPLSYRAIGDVTLQPYVTCHPEILQRVIGPEDEYLLLASDGLWVRQKFQPLIIWPYFFLFFSFFCVSMKLLIEFLFQFCNFIFRVCYFYLF